MCRRRRWSSSIRALSYDVDFQRELKEGMKFTVLLEQLVTQRRPRHPSRAACWRASCACSSAPWS